MKRIASALLVLLAAVTAATTAERVGNAQKKLPPPVTIRQLGPPPPSPPPLLHPDIAFLDNESRPVVVSGGPLSLMRSCGLCHDTDFISTNNYHSQVGLDEMVRPGDAPSGRPWDTGPGLFGRFDPFVGRFLTPPGEEPLDLGTADWIRMVGPRHVGGGPAFFSRIDGSLLGSRRSYSATDPDGLVLDEKTGMPRPWDWRASGVVELDCLLCHMRSPDNLSRIEALREGRFAWASTATLIKAGLVERRGSAYLWNRSAFSPDGTVPAKRLGLTHALTENCRQCHGRACRCTDRVVFESSRDNWSAETSGTVFSAERMCNSGMNLHDKDSLKSPWDIHAERLLQCASCHHSPNNPAYVRMQEKGEGLLRHLAFDARRATEASFLYRPDHNFVKGDVAQGTVASHLSGTMRVCRDCHRAEEVHPFLPFVRTHFSKLECTACHVPRVYPATRRMTDSTVLTAQGAGVRDYAGVEGPVDEPTSLLTGQVPVLLAHRSHSGAIRFGPHLLHSSWFWVAGDPPRPVRHVDLERALFDQRGNYLPEIVEAFDSDRDGTIAVGELRLETPEKIAAVRRRLEEVGVENPRIYAEIQPFGIGHGVGDPSSAVRECSTCHQRKGRFCQPVLLAPYVPGGIVPDVVRDAGTILAGSVEVSADGRLMLRPSRCSVGLYVTGAQRMGALDGVGVLIVAVSFAGSSIHGFLRIVAWRRRAAKGGVT
jgi:hypothetical protein